LALALLTSGDRSISIVRLRTETTEFFFIFYFLFFILEYSNPLPASET
jgi:hypothetical protein